jgi:hypothetical protein
VNPSLFLIVATQNPKRSGPLWLQRHCGRHGPDSDADLHRGVFGEHDVAAARDEVNVHRAPRAKRTHRDAEGIRTRRNSYSDAHKFKPVGPAR